MFEVAFQRDGYLIIDRLFDPELIDRVRAEAERWTGPIDRDDPPVHLNVGDRRLHMPIRLTGPLLDPALWANPLLLGILSPILDQDFLLDNGALVTALPGAPAMRIHADHPSLFTNRMSDGALPCFAVSVGIPLVDLDEKTGTTELICGSIGAYDEKDVDPASATVTPFVRRGGCFLLDYRLWHRGMANRSARPRPILYLTYARPWFIDIRNFELHERMIVQRDALQGMTFEQRRLLRRVAAKGLIDATMEELHADKAGAQERKAAVKMVSRVEGGAIPGVDS